MTSVHIKNFIKEAILQIFSLVTGDGIICAYFTFWPKRSESNLQIAGLILLLLIQYHSWGN